MMPKVAHELNDADERILDTLASGRNLPQNIARELNYSRQYVQNRLQMLKAADYVENVGGGLYELVDDPREGTDGPQDVDREALRETIAEARQAFEDVDSDRLKAALDRAEELLGMEDRR
jgi:biotin operon repressor